jgi:energy-coupling factor transporter ATP-binding protein EcfA2
VTGKQKQAPRDWFVLVAGWPGSGKSTLAAALAAARYRARTGRRHAGHLDGARGDAELWEEPASSPGLGPVVDVDTSGPVDVPEVAARLARALAAGQVPRRQRGAAGGNEPAGQTG